MAVSVNQSLFFLTYNGEIEDFEQVTLHNPEKSLVLTAVSHVMGRHFHGDFPKQLLERTEVTGVLAHGDLIPMTADQVQKLIVSVKKQNPRAEDEERLEKISLNHIPTAAYAPGALYEIEISRDEADHGSYHAAVKPSGKGIYNTYSEYRTYFSRVTSLGNPVLGEIDQPRPYQDMSLHNLFIVYDICYLAHQSDDETYKQKSLNPDQVMEAQAASEGSYYCLKRVIDEFSFRGIEMQLPRECTGGCSVM